MVDTPSKRRLPLRAVDSNTPDAQRRRGEGGKAVSKQQQSYSHEVLTKCGIFLDIDGEGTCVCNEVVRSRLMLGQILLQQSHRSKEFMEQIGEYWADDEKLLASLKPLDVEGVHAGSLHTKSYLDSFAKLLLRIQPIQSMVIDVLIERMTTLAGAIADSSLSQDHPCSLILLHLRYLDMIHDPSSLTNKLLEVLDVCPRPLQIEILMAIPEVVVSADYAVVLEKYEDLLMAEAGLVATILDSITNLCLPPAMLHGPSELALQMLESAEHAQVPALVRFLLEICGPDNAVNIIEQVRQNLCSLVALPLDDDEARSSVSMVIDILRGSFQFREVISKAYVKVLDKDASQTLLSVDYWILFSLFDLVKFRTKVLSIFNKRSAHRRQTKQSLAEALLPGASALGSLFQPMLSAAQSMLATGVNLSGTPPRAHWMGELLYLNLYSTYRSGFQRQEIIVALVGHAATGASHEVTNALRILKTISDQQPTSNEDETYIDQPAEQPFSSFIPFLKVLLDSVQRLTHEQLRMLFDIIFRSASVEQHAGDDVVIFLKKLLASTRADMRRIGVLGSVSLMCCRSPVENDHTEDASRSSLSQLSQELLLPKYRNLTKRESSRPFHADYAESVFAAVSDLPECFTFLIDELSLAMSDRRMADLIFMRWLFDRFSTELMSTFVTDPDRAVSSSSGSSSSSSSTSGGGGSGANRGSSTSKNNYLFMGGALKGTLQLGLTGEDAHVDACVRLLPVATLRNEEDRHLLTYLAPVLRLVMECAQALSKCSPELLNNLAPILTSPLLIPEDNAFNEIDDLSVEIRAVMCLCLKHSVDWLRELVNCFVEHDMDNKQALILRRLEHLSDAEALLIDMTMRHPAYLRSLHPPVDYEVLFQKAPKAAPKPKRKAAAMSGEQGDEPNVPDEETPAVKQLVGKDAARQLIEQSARPLKPSAVFALGFTNAIRKHRNERGLTQGEERVAISLPILTMLLNHLDDHLTKKKQNQSIVEFLSKLGRVGVFQRINGFLRDSIDAFAGEVQESVLQTEIDDVEDLWLPLRSTLGIMTKAVGLLSADDAASAADGNDEQSLHEILLATVAQLANFPVDASKLRLEDVQRSFGSCFDLLASLAPAIKSLELIVELVKCLETLIRAFLKACAHTAGVLTSADTQALTARLSEVCDDILKRDWVDPTGKRRYTQKDLGYIVKTHLDWAPRPIERLQALAQDVLPELLDTVNSVGPVEAYPTITAASFVCYFVPLFVTLIESWKKVTSSSNTDAAESDSDEDDQPVVAKMARLVSVFESLVKFTRGNAVLENKVVLSAVLREGRKFIDAFLKSRPVLSAAFKTHQDDVLVMFRVLQGSTRQIQSVCAHGKVLKDASMSREAPAIKKALEQLIFEVKQMAKENSCLKALWVGNLKHRNIDGTEARESDDEEDSQSDAAESYSEQEGEAEDEGEE